MQKSLIERMSAVLQKGRYGGHEYYTTTKARQEREGSYRGSRCTVKHSAGEDTMSKKHKINISSNINRKSYFTTPLFLTLHYIEIRAAAMASV